MRLLQAVADIVRTTLGPRAMLKMLLDASGGDDLLLTRCFQTNDRLLLSLGVSLQRRHHTDQ